MRLEGKVAIVTGAAGAGIGQGVSWALAREGAKVVVSDAHLKRPFEVADKIKSETGQDTLGIVCDVTKKDHIDNMVKETLDKFGKVDILVNNAGGNKLQQVAEMDEEVWDFVINVNLKSTFLCSKAVLPSMIKQKYGRIVNVSSSIFLVGSKDGEAHYTAAKAGIVGFTRALCKEVGEHNINVNCIAPGLIMNDFLLRIYPKEYFEGVEKEIPMGRAGEPSDIAGAVLFLVTDDGKYMTGQTLSVSGGWCTY
ncbi:MAG: SDR family NAD(P)-dependent oxidoreductase [Thermodesulfobacteriota bacterium]|nr:SDR family NAD(P)-dependent oxidoreductase [Thermodesulfobacteriota bacterium]